MWVSAGKRERKLLKQKMAEVESSELGWNMTIEEGGITTTASQDMRWKTIQQLLSRPSAFPNESGQLPNGYYEPSTQVGMTSFS